MRYGFQYIVYKFSESSLEVVNNAIKINENLFQKPLVGNSSDPNLRKGNIKWIKDPKLYRVLNDIVGVVNKNSWNLKITSGESMQYGIYNIGDHYDWHNDQLLIQDQLVRKVSMSLFLNDPDEYDGGELDIDFKNPNDDPRYDTLKLDSGYAVFFESHLWHRVRPIKSGVRKSLVAWFSGPRYV
tara:strand:- start:133 stop:684 length:552 start_codon:yes stop_codon:yes gene_type:complete